MNMNTSKEEVTKKEIVINYADLLRMDEKVKDAYELMAKEVDRFNPINDDVTMSYWAILDIQSDLRAVFDDLRIVAAHIASLKI